MVQPTSCSSLAACYTGPLAGFTPPLVGGAVPKIAVEGSRWRNAALLEQDMASFAAQYPGGDKRAIASLWSKWHFSALTVPTLTANLLLNRDLPVGLDDVYLIANEKGCTRQLWLPHAGTPFSSYDPSQRFATLIAHHWTPLIERLSALCGAAPRVFWSNAGGYVDYYVNALAAHPQVDPQALSAARVLLDSRTLNGQRNPLFEPLRNYQPSDSSEVKRVRKLCCLRYLLDEFEICGNCPLEGCNRATRKARR